MFNLRVFDNTYLFVAINISMTSLIFFYLLTIKHAIADLHLQARLNNRGSKADLKTPRLWIHCLDHAVLTFFVALFIVDIPLAIALSLLDFMAHFVIDYTKTRIQKHNGVGYDSKTYWFYASIDQAAHFTTYFAIVLLST